MTAALFNLAVALLLAAHLLRRVRRFERRMDALEARGDAWHADLLARMGRRHAEDLAESAAAWAALRGKMVTPEPVP